MLTDLRARLEKRSLSNLLRHRIVERKVRSDFSSNDYLGISKSLKLKHSLIKQVRKNPLGNRSSNMISGYHFLTKQVEDKFAEMLKRKRAILFNNGYMANLGLFQVIAQRKDQILSDKSIHRSLLDGIALSQARHKRFLHMNLKHLEQLLSAETYSKQFVVTESVFSMEGRITPFFELLQLVKSYRALLVIDDAHGFGILGHQGLGVCEEFQLSQRDLFALITPLGKALGVMGAFISGDSELIESLIQFSSTYIYTTSLPLVVIAAIDVALDILVQESWRKEKLQENIDYFHQTAMEKGVDFLSKSKTPIKCISIPKNKNLAELKNTLNSQDIFIPIIRPPTVTHPILRMSLTALHQFEEIKRAVEILAKCL